MRQFRFRALQTGRRMAAAVPALCLAAGLATGAQAADGDAGKWYVGANIPVMFIDSTDTKVSGSATAPAPTSYSTTATSSYGVGYRIGGVVGYHITPDFRLEGELFYGRARVTKTVYSGTQFTGPNPQAPTTTITIPVPGRITQPNTGSVTLLGAMANIWYDIDTGTNWTPFVGGGLGMYSIDFSDVKWDPDTLCSGIATALMQPAQPGCGLRPDDRDTVFAYQVGGGVGYRVSDALTVQLGYKYQLGPGINLDGKNAVTNVKTETSMRVHLVEIGLRYRF